MFIGRFPVGIRECPVLDFIECHGENLVTCRELVVWPEDSVAPVVTGADIPASLLTSRVVRAARPARPWLCVKASPRVTRFLVAAGASSGHIARPHADLFGWLSCQART